MPQFTSRTISFLRALKRHNDRDWFREHRSDYDREVRAPLVAVVDSLARDLRRFAPELIASSKGSLYRIYRDTRFSEDKSPLKTHVAAVFPCRGLAKHEGAGLYFEVAATHCWIGGGMYMPQTWQLQLVREHIAHRYARFRRIVESSEFEDVVGTLDGERLQRVPRGFAKDHPAAHYLKFRQFLGGREYPASLAARPRFYPELLKVFRAVAPLVRFLNEPLLAHASLTASAVPPGEDVSERDLLGMR